MKLLKRLGSIWPTSARDLRFRGFLLIFPGSLEAFIVGSQKGGFQTGGFGGCSPVPNFLQ